MYYFGTNLTEAGHFFFELQDDHMKRLGLSFPENGGIPISRQKQWPFNPEDFPRYSKGETSTRGEVGFYVEAGYTILAICGSPIDKRPGCKSVFFKKGDCSFVDMAEEVYAIAVAKKIIDSFSPHIYMHPGLAKFGKLIKK